MNAGDGEMEAGNSYDMICLDTDEAQIRSDGSINDYL